MHPFFVTEKRTYPCLDTPYASERSPEEIAEVARLLKRIGRDSWLRELVHPYNGTAQIPQGQILALLSQVTGDYELHWRESLLAAALLGQIQPSEKQTPSAVKELCDLLDKKSPAPSQLFSQRYAHSSRRAFLLSLGVSALVALSPRLGFPKISPDDTLATLLVIFLLAVLPLWVGLKFLLLPISVAIDARRGARVRATVARTLGRWHKPRSVGTLAKAAHDFSPIVRREAILALPGVLETLTPDHYGLLPTETVPALCRLLETGGWLGLDTTQRWRIQILTALEKIGDGRAVTTVERLTHDPSMPDIQREATRILPLLLERQREEQSRTLLLRSSAPPREPFAELLHPAKDGVTPKEELLRSHAAG